MIVVVLFTALLAPWFIDWTRYKADFEREASRVIGQPVQVKGAANLRLLPLPSVTFDGLEVGRYQDGSAMMTVDQFALDMELMPLLKSQVRIVEMNLVRPKVTVRVNENGTIAWTDRQQFIVDPEKVKLEDVRIENGSVRIEGLAGGRVIELERLYGETSARSLFGPWRIAVDGFVDGERASLNIATGQLQASGQIRVKATMRPAKRPYRITLDGPVALSDGVLGWSGAFELAARRTNADGSPLTGAPQPLPVHVDGDFALTPRLADVTDFRLEIGDRADPYTITGSGSANIQDEIFFNVIADGRQIDIDRIARAEQASGSSGLGLERRLAALRDVLEQVPVPTVNGQIDLKLPAVIAGDTLIREVGAKLRPEGPGWKLEWLEAVLPGNTGLEAWGKVGLGHDFGFTGHLIVASRQPTGLAAWLGREAGPELRRLESTGFAADVTISNRQQSLENLELRLGSAVLGGKLQRLMPQGARPAVIVELSGERINLDDLRAIQTLVTERGSGEISDHDLDITVSAGVLEGLGVTARDVSSRFTVTGGSVSVKKFDATDFLGAELDSYGHIDDLLNRPNGNFQLHVSAADPSGLVGFLRDKLGANTFIDNFADNPALLGELDLTVTINARAADAGSRGFVIFDGSAGGTDIESKISFEGRRDDLAGVELGISASLVQQDPARLLAQLALPVLPVAVDGPLEVSAELSGHASTGLDAHVSAMLPTATLTANGTLGFAAEGDIDRASGRLTLGAQDIDPMVLLSGLAIPGAGEGMPASVSATVEADRQGARFESISGQIAGNEFAGDLALEVPLGANVAIDGELTADRLSLPLFAAVAHGRTGREMADFGEEVWSDTAFGPPLMSGLDGQIAVAADKIDMGIGEPATAAAGKLVLSNGNVSIEEAGADWLGGRITGGVSFGNTDGTGVFSIKASLDGANAGIAATTFDLAPAVSGRFDVDGSVEGSGRSVRGLVAGLTGGGTVHIEAATVAGVNLSPLPYVFEQVDVEGFEIQDESVAPIVEAVIREGELELAGLSVPFLVTGGKAKARNIALEARGTRITVDGEADLVSRALDAGMVLKFDPGKEWVTGADPEVSVHWRGDRANPARELDVQPLSGFLSIRNYEREQRRVEILQASILEKQRLRRDVIGTNARIRYRQRLRDEELRRQRQLLQAREELRLRELAALVQDEMHAEEARIAAEEEARRRALEEEARRIEIEQRRREEEARRLEAERLAELERLRAEEEARQAALREEQARIEAQSQTTTNGRVQIRRPLGVGSAGQGGTRRANEDAATGNRPTLSDEFLRRLNELFIVE